MKNLRFAIIGPHTENTLDLEEEIAKRGHTSCTFGLKDLYLEMPFSQGGIFWQGEKVLEKFDIFIFRAFERNVTMAQIMARILLRSGKTVIDEALGKDFIPGKVFEASVIEKAGLNHPRTFQASSLNTWKSILPKLSFPVIIKPIRGQKGQNVTKVNSPEEYESFLSQNPKEYLLQEFLKIDSDIRVFVVKDKALGAMRRYILEGDFRSNASLGSRTEAMPLTQEMEKIAVSAAQAIGYEIAGVDLIEFQGKIYVLEINVGPQWQAFKKATGINPAPEIISYAIEKYEKN